MTKYECTVRNKSLGKVGKFKYLGTTVANKNYTQGKIRTTLSSGNSCSSVQNPYHPVSYLKT